MYAVKASEEGLHDFVIFMMRNRKKRQKILGYKGKG